VSSAGVFSDYLSNIIFGQFLRLFLQLFEHILVTVVNDGAPFDNTDKFIRVV
jgi:hypothetical protein